MTPRTRPACLAILAAWPLLAGPAGAQDGNSPPDRRAAQAANPLGDVPLDAVTHFLDRPLFVGSRRKPAVLPVAVAAPAAPPPSSAPSAANFRLLGTIATAAGASAMIQDTGSGRTRTVGSGETVDRWRIAEIQASKVRLEADGRSVWLEIFGPSAPATAAAGGLSASGPNPVPVPPTPASPPPAAPLAAPPLGSGEPAPRGTVAGTAAAEAARRSPYSLTFGTAAPKAGN